MKQRTKAPASTNKFYLKKPYGYNPCILGNKAHRQYPHSVLVNCTGYCTGRFGETSGAKKCEYLGNTNAENYIELAKKQGLEVGTEPRDGAVIVWQGVGSKAGHCGFVEKAKSKTEIFTSESGWSYKNHYILNKTRKKGADGNWGLSTSSYKDPMFIYNPNIDPYPATTKKVLKLGDKGEDVKWLQWAICRAGYKIAIDGSFGYKTEKALKKAQKSWKLTADGMCGKKTQAKIKSLYSIEG